jgi:hypothetical protein
MNKDEQNLHLLLNILQKCHYKISNWFFDKDKSNVFLPDKVVLIIFLLNENDIYIYAADAVLK